VDVARHASIPSDLIDATVSESSLHYSTSRDNDRRAIDYGFGFYMSAISARHSQDDVTPRGQHIAFDLERWSRARARARADRPDRPRSSRCARGRGAGDPDRRDPAVSDLALFNAGVADRGRCRRTRARVAEALIVPYGVPGGRRLGLKRIRRGALRMVAEAPP
jgi:hypothetical protein